MLHGEGFENAGALIQRGYGYWKNKAGARPAPAWSDINPAEIRDLLPNVVVIHVQREPLDFVERITGQRILDNGRRNSMGVPWREFPGRGPNSRIWQVMADVVEQRQPNFQKIPYVGRLRDFLYLQTIVCPISDDGETVNKLLGFVDYLRR